MGARQHTRSPIARTGSTRAYTCAMPSSDIYMSVVNALRQHWQAHNEAYPQKIILTQQQADDLLHRQQVGMVAFPDARTTPRIDRFMNTPIEIDASTTGVMIGIDGQPTPLP